MRLLDRYLLRELCVPLVYCLVGFLIFWVSFDLFADLDDFQKAGLSAAEITRYYLVRLPDLLVTVLPVALLLALLYALTKHGRHNEIIAMRAAGLSLVRISVPYLLIGSLLSLALFYLNEELVPSGAERAEVIKRGRAAAEAQSHWLNRVDFRNASERRIWNMSQFNTETFEMIEPHVEWWLTNGTRKQLIAKRGGRTNDQWIFYDVEFFSYETNVDFEKLGSRPIRTNMMTVPELTEKPKEIKLQLRFQRMNAMDAAKRTQLSLSEIRYLRKHLELNRRDQALLETQYQARLAQPWTCLVVVLVALPFGASATSRRNVFVGVASSIFIVFVYFVVLRLGLALGTGGFVPPWLAAWAPNVLFAGTGVAMAWKAS
ncbi:MAG TPA: LptF/LptG family permease [Verrucomicrobiae bacterium]|jgi:lipopolysaccharide export system permease protein|nr:LptF/LptG family permease [Verrucomicrobiae bacterium]